MRAVATMSESSGRGWRLARSEGKTCRVMLTETRSQLEDLQRRVDALRGSL